MSDLITSQMLSDWRANYGLDKRTPIKAMHWWQDNMDGMAPAGVVAALGLCINEIERLTAERDELRRQLAEAELDAQRYRWLRGDSCPDHSVRWTQWEVRCWRAPKWTADLRRSALDVAIDAAMGGGDAG